MAGKQHTAEMAVLVHHTQTQDGHLVRLAPKLRICHCVRLAEGDLLSYHMTMHAIM